MKNKKGSIASISITIIATLIILSVIIVVCCYASEYLNYGAKEGFIIDKQYNPAYTYMTYNSTYVNGNSVNMPMQHYSGERYYFTIQKEVKGKIKSINVNVTQDEFEKYNIGDYFKR